MSKRIDDLMAQMTLEEKLGQLNQLTPPATDVITGAYLSTDVKQKILDGKVGSILNAHELKDVIELQKLALQSRLGIPMIFALDVVHGHNTTFPVNLGLASSMNMELIEKTARVAAIQASATGIKWTFAPMLDISRDPRWGRCAESPGEDAFLASRIGEAMVRGFQGDDLSDPESILACAKHLVGYGAAEGGRDYANAEISVRRLHDDYLAPFKAAVVNAKCGSIMPSFNAISGVAATGNKELLTDILRTSWGFKGLVVSDYGAVPEMIKHGVGDLEAVSQLAIEAGVDIEMALESYQQTMPKLIAEGKISEALIDLRCRAVLEMKEALGLFDDFMGKLTAEREAMVINNPEHLAVAREAAAAACILLKNDNNILPLKKQSKIALIGPLADDQYNMLGTWAIRGKPDTVVTVLAGMKDVGGADAEITYSRGSNITDDQVERERLNVFSNAEKPREAQVIVDPRSPDQMIEAALKAVAKSDIAVLVVGEAKEHAGEASSRTKPYVPESQQKLMRAIKATGKPMVLVVAAGRPLILDWESKNADAILYAWHGGHQAGNAIADILYGDKNPSGKVAMSFPRSVGQIPVYHSQEMTGRPLPIGQDYAKYTSCYQDEMTTPLYAFGHGLSYSTFQYGPVLVNKTSLSGDETLRASVTIKNTSDRAGREVVQLYITDPVRSLTPPKIQLKGFEGIELQPQEARQVSFDITPDLLSFFDNKAVEKWEPGEFIVRIGTASDQLQSASVKWEKATIVQNVPKVANLPPKP